MNHVDHSHKGGVIYYIFRILSKIISYPYIMLNI